MTKLIFTLLLGLTPRSPAVSSLEDSVFLHSNIFFFISVLSNFFLPVQYQLSEQSGYYKEEGIHSTYSELVLTNTRSFSSNTRT